MTASTPSPCSSATLSGDETTPIGMPPALSTYCTAKLPRPPLAPQTSTRSPWVTGFPLCETSIR